MKKFLLTDSDDKDQLLEFTLSLLSVSLQTLEAPANAEREWMSVFMGNLHHNGPLDEQLRITPMIASPVQGHLSAAELDKTLLAVARRLDNELSVLQRGAMINLVRNATGKFNLHSKSERSDIIDALDAEFALSEKTF
ncbi:hypothetical protein [Idiomarina abyssalis]|uniref:Uncharacterized protein n=1 Tax=Idiomarina abyssalis TaxID=86102 RepID=A0A8I1KIE7_9GAMM|nr:hypothetical protein [Idiomarina abyssalis]MBJ7265496.1 hypothetical protein [Idiomarina abyssalis]MBJ7316830.1 hypothetical protein [Idiomarina abyssalis]